MHCETWKGVHRESGVTCQGNGCTGLDGVLEGSSVQGFQMAGMSRGLVPCAELFLINLQASAADHKLGSELFEKIPRWLQNGTLQTNNSKVLSGGLSAVPEGFQMHRDGKISGFKLVYEL